MYFLRGPPPPLGAADWAVELVDWVHFSGAYNPIGEVMMVEPV